MKKPIYLLSTAALIVAGGLYLTKEKPLKYENKPGINKSSETNITNLENLEHKSSVSVDKTYSAEEDREVARYNDIVLKKSDVNQTLRKLFDGKFPENKNDFDELDDGFKENILKSLVGSELVEKEAKIAKIEESEKFKDQLVELSKKLSSKIYLDEKIKAYLTPNLIQERYTQFLNEWGNKEEIKAKHILVASEDEAKKIVKNINSGTAFEDEAKSKSTDSSKDKGGDLGYFTKGQMVKEFEDVAFGMNVGQVSEPVKTAFGWHIIKVEDKRKLNPPSFDEIKPRLETELSMKFIQSYNDELFKNNKVEIFAIVKKPENDDKNIDKK